MQRAISGGSTPKLLFTELAKEHLIDPMGFPKNNVHRIQAELEPKTAARLYADEISKVFGLKASQFPQFDIIHRGMGPDAHAASLFPGEPSIDNHENLVATVYVEKFHPRRRLRRAMTGAESHAEQAHPS